MKFILVILALVAAVSCSPDAPKANSYNEPVSQLTMKGSAIDLEYVTYKVVIIDDNEYFACRTYNGYWILCPKLPAKKP